MKKICSLKLALVGAILVCLPTTLLADRFGKDAIYVVDMGRVVEESQKGIKAKKSIEEQLKKQTADIEKKKMKLEEEGAALQKQAPLLSQTAYETKVKDFIQARNELMKEVQEKSAELQKRRGALIAKIVGEANTVITQLAKENGYRFVIERGQNYVVYMDEDLDLTDDVIDLLDSKK